MVNTAPLSLLAQLKGLTSKTFKVYFRQKHQLILEFVFAVYFLGILFFVGSTEDTPSVTPDVITHETIPALSWTATCSFLNTTDCAPLSYAPSDSDFANEIAARLALLHDLTPVAYESEEELHSAFSESPNRFGAAFIIKASTNAPHNVVLRVQNSLMNENLSNWHLSPFTSFHADVASVITFIEHNTDVSFSFQLKHFPTHHDPMPIGANQMTLPMYLVMGSLFFVTSLITALVTEKEKLLKQSLGVIGMMSVSYWLSYLIVFGFVSFIVTVLWVSLSVAIGIIELSPYFLAIYATSYFMYFLALSAFCFCFSTLFSKVKLALGVFTTFHMVFSFSGLVLVLLVFNAPEKSRLENVLNFVPHFNFYDLIFNLMTGVLFEVEDLWNFSANVTGRRTVADNLYLLIFNFFFWFILTLYFDKIIATQFSKPKKPFFFFQPRFWADWLSIFKPLQIADNVPALQVSKLVKSYKLSKSEMKQKKKEDPTFDSNLFTAVDDVSFVLPVGHTFGFLGANGAGKSTTVNCAVGILDFNDGDIMIAGMSVKTDMDRIRRLIGFVPQQDVLFDYLSVKEHLELWGTIKNVNKDVIQQQCKQLLQGVGLHNDMDKLPTELSGGMKRKLCLCSAFMGNPLLLFLDEISTGIDPDSRRQIWDLMSMKKQQAQHSIVLVTHYIEEAEVLADDVVVMASAKIRAHGSPAQLAIQHSSQYLVTFAKDQGAVDASILNCVKSVVGEGSVLASSASQLVVGIPSKKKSEFGLLSETLEKNLQNLNILSFGFQTSTLEDIYLKIVELYQPESQGEV
ncbi:hypothetical protein GEMRC1_007467 [Eukaryota sp. GEM-RC1]